MKFLRYFCLYVSITMFLACSVPIAQTDAPQVTPNRVGTAANVDNEEDGQVSQRLRLEQSLERMNGVITDAPSRLHHQRAEVLFRLGRFGESVRDYDTAVRYGRPHTEDSCWERGLAQYYAGDFRSARDQFSGYHRVGSLDIENGLWRFLCIAEEEGIAKARETMLKYPRKTRKPFPALLSLYLDQGSAEAVLEEASSDTSSKRALTTNLFYGHYYLAKYYQITDQEEKALSHVRKALEHKIAHFMYACAEADAKLLDTQQKSPSSP
jgi:tetratricopeptide (TPR) repeat protein